VHDLTLPQVHYGLSLLLLEVYCTLGVDYICHHVQRQLQRNESARYYHHRTRKCLHHVSYAETYSRSMVMAKDGEVPPSFQL
jgi:hypothetical protein